MDLLALESFLNNEGAFNAIRNAERNVRGRREVVKADLQDGFSDFQEHEKGRISLCPVLSTNHYGTYILNESYTKIQIYSVAHMALVFD